MKILGILLGLFILVGCQTTPPVEPKVEKVQEKKKSKIGIMTISCIDISAILDLSEADRISAQEVQARLQQYMILRKCGVHNPRIAVPLETLIAEYIDFMGIETQIWKVKNLDLWTLIAKNVIQYERQKEKRDNNKTSV